jgi:adenosylcobinamide-GDP ribazoletransferase
MTRLISTKRPIDRASVFWSLSFRDQLSYKNPIGRQRICVVRTMSDPYPQTTRAGFDFADWIVDLRLALSFLTRIRLSKPHSTGLDTSATTDGPTEFQAESPAPDMARALRVFPLVGLLIGLLGAVVYTVGYHLSVPPFAAALCVLAMTAFITGAMHEDGLADFADGLAGGNSPEDRLRIMADSRIGPAGALGLLFVVGLKAAALATLETPGAVASALIAAAAGSRALFPVVMTRLPAARPDGLAAMVGIPTPGVTMTAIIIGVVTMIFFLGIGHGLVGILIASLATIAASTLALRTLGGYTGDALGAIQQVTEVAILLAAAAMQGAS